MLCFPWISCNYLLWDVEFSSEHVLKQFLKSEWKPEISGEKKKKGEWKINESSQVIWASCFCWQRTLPFTFNNLVAAIISVIPKLKCFPEIVWEICQNCLSCRKFWLDSISIFRLKWFVETKKYPDSRFINVFPQLQVNRKKIMTQRDVFEAYWFLRRYPWGQGN